VIYTQSRNTRTGNHASTEINDCTRGTRRRAAAKAATGKLGCATPEANAIGHARTPGTPKKARTGRRRQGRRTGTSSTRHAVTELWPCGTNKPREDSSGGFAASRSSSLCRIHKRRPKSSKAKDPTERLQTTQRKQRRPKGGELATQDTPSHNRTPVQTAQALAPMAMQPRMLFAGNTTTPCWEHRDPLLGAPRSFAGNTTTPCGEHRDPLLGTP
jgi:hypothetical protein